jgi:hypothetical protein
MSLLFGCFVGEVAEHLYRDTVSEVGRFDFIFPLELHKMKEISFDNVVSFSCIDLDG